MTTVIHLRAQHPLNDAMCNKLANRFAVACLQEKVTKTVFDVTSSFAVGDDYTAIQYRLAKIIDCCNFEFNRARQTSAIKNLGAGHDFSICIEGVSQTSRTGLEKSLQSILNWNFPKTERKIAIRFQ